jgi:hypothetical protein
MVTYFDKDSSPELEARDRIREHLEQLVVAIKHAEDHTSNTAQGAC